MGEIVLLPPRERHWTSCERFLIDRTIADLRGHGFNASYYEWLTANEVWCSFRLGHRNVIADLGRIGRAYRLEWSGNGPTLRTHDLAYALTMMVAKWAYQVP
jgi:hypothetical protein